MKENEKIFEYKEAIKKLFYPLKAKIKQGIVAENTFNLALLKGLREVGELFVTNLADLLLQGEEIADIVIKDLEFF